MVTMTWNMIGGPDGRPVLQASWSPVVVPGPRTSSEDRPVDALKAS
jgi:hypothetical protein